jgi:hypothetical protein
MLRTMDKVMLSLAVAAGLLLFAVSAWLAF